MGLKILSLFNRYLTSIEALESGIFKSNTRFPIPQSFHFKQVKNEDLENDCTNNDMHTIKSKVGNSVESIIDCNDCITDDYKICKPKCVKLKNVFKLHCLQKGPEESTLITKVQAKRYIMQMQIVRRLENASFCQRATKCSLYSHPGQEACTVGMWAAIRPQDNIISATRSMSWSYLMGQSPHNLLNEISEKKSFDKNMINIRFMYSPKFFGGNAMMGMQVPFGTGLAFASKYKQDNSVCIACCEGDECSVANKAQMYESYNIASAWKLPVIFISENNMYGLSNRNNRVSCNSEYYNYISHIPSIWVDSMSVLGIRSATKFAINFALKNGPIILRTCTYRNIGDSIIDKPQNYRSLDDLQATRQYTDPIQNFRAMCLSNNVINEQELQEIEEKVKIALPPSKINAKPLLLQGASSILKTKIQTI